MNESIPFDSEEREPGNQPDLRSHTEKQQDSEEFLRDWEWKINIALTSDDVQEAQRGFDIVRELKLQYGENNVLVLKRAYDADQDAVVDRVPGKLGVWVRKGVESREVD